MLIMTLKTQYGGEMHFAAVHMESISLIWTDYKQLGVFPLFIIKTVVCFSSSLEWQPHPLQPRGSKGLIVMAPILCVLFAPSDLHITRWQLLRLPLQLWGFWPFLCRWTKVMCSAHVSPRSGVFLPECSGFTTKYDAHAPLHALVVAFPLPDR